MKLVIPAAILVLAGVLTWALWPHERANPGAARPSATATNAARPTPLPALGAGAATADAAEDQPPPEPPDPYRTGPGGRMPPTRAPDAGPPRAIAPGAVAGDAPAIPTVSARAVQDSVRRFWGTGRPVPPGGVEASEVLPPEAIQALHMPADARLTMLGSHRIDDRQAFEQVLGRAPDDGTPIGVAWTGADGVERRDYLSVQPAPRE